MHTHANLDTYIYVHIANVQYLVQLDASCSKGQFVPCTHIHTCWYIHGNTHHTHTMLSCTRWISSLRTSGTKSFNARWATMFVLNIFIYVYRNLRAHNMPALVLCMCITISFVRAWPMHFNLHHKRKTFLCFVVVVVVMVVCVCVCVYKHSRAHTRIHTCIHTYIFTVSANRPHYRLLAYHVLSYIHMGWDTLQVYYIQTALLSYLCTYRHVQICREICKYLRSSIFSYAVIMFWFFRCVMCRA